MANEAVKMANDLLTGKKPAVNDTKSYNNKVKVVPSYLFQPVVVATSLSLLESDFDCGINGLFAIRIVTTRASLKIAV